ncbi:MAG: sterol carrier protein domain-containing protein, partial [Micrococcaceae bacterium]|nr:sterol carrier protein domain-containing protein [Micrococcaceae bacterium]
HRAAVHLDDAGRIDGYVTYAFAGWDPKPITLEVRDLVTTTAAARRELFRFLALHDLVERVSYPVAAADDPLPWALEDPARVTYAERGHCLWVRVLDVPVAFAARHYNGSGSFTLRVQDPMGLAGGCYGFEILDGRATVTALPEGTVGDAACNVSALGPLLLGAAGIADLAGAGLLEPASERVLGMLAGFLDLPGLPHAINEF